MDRILIKMAAFVMAAVSMTSCYDDFTADYDYPNMGFALPKQVRTVVSTTNRIYIGVSIGGKREVDMKDWANFTLDETLLAGTGLSMLPESYYELADPNTFRPRKSNLAVADVGITFTDAFYEDEACMNNTYALPFRLLATSIPEKDNPYGAIRDGAETTIAVIKYISGYSGTYYKLGTVVESTPGSGSLETTYSKKDLSANETVALVTKGRNTVYRPGLGNSSDGGLLLEIVEAEGADTYEVNVTMVGGGPELITASATYLKKGDYKLYSGEEDAPQIDLAYSYEKNGTTYEVTESLVLRQWAERELRVETF